jgi:membrane protein required for colicin V production
LNTFDIIIILIVGYCVIRGVFRGIIKEASSIIGVLAGLYAAYTYYPTLSNNLAHFKNMFSSAGVMNIVSFLVIFFVVFMSVSALGILIKMMLKIIFLSWVDRLFGALFGMIKGVMIVSAILLVLTTFLSSGTPVIAQSVLCPYVSSIAETMSRFSSSGMRHEFNSKLDVAKKSWDNEGVPPTAVKQTDTSRNAEVKSIEKPAPKPGTATVTRSTAKPGTPHPAGNSKATGKSKPGTSPKSKQTKQTVKPSE